MFKVSAEDKSKNQLIDRAEAIISSVEATMAPPSVEQQQWASSLDEGVEFDLNEQCAPYSFEPSGEKCRSCPGFKICLKRDIGLRVEEVLNPED